MVKDQLKPKADWRAVDSPEIRTNGFVLYAFLLFTANKTNLFVRFFGESTASQSCFWFYQTFKGQLISNVLLASSFGPKYQRKNLTKTAPESKKW